MLWDNAVDSRVGKASLAVDVLLGLFAQLALNEPSPCGCGIDGVLAGDDGDGVVERTGLDSLGDGLSDELEDVGADSAGDDVGASNLLNDLVHLVLGVDSTVVVDGELALAVVTNLGDSVCFGLLEGLDDAVHDVDEDDLVARVVKELGDEATADVTTAKVYCLLLVGHDVWLVGVCGRFGYV